MQNFEIVFIICVRINRATNKPGKARIDHREGGYHRRSIAALNIHQATIVADAMLGEEIFVGQYLYKVEKIYETSSPPEITSFAIHYTWARVLEKLAIPFGEANFCSHIKEKEGKIVCEPIGILLSEDQAKRAIKR